MRMLTGAILILSGVHAFGYAHSVGFPERIYVEQVLSPTSLVLALAGVGFLIWGVISDGKTQT